MIWPPIPWRDVAIPPSATRPGGVEYLADIFIPIDRDDLSTIRRGIDDGPISINGTLAFVRNVRLDIIGATTYAAISLVAAEEPRVDG